MTDLILKSNDEKRFALGVLYIPGTEDAHGEYIEADELQTATWAYVLKGDLRLRRQHDPDEVIGHVVELFTLPWAVEAPVTVGKVRKRLKLPAGTVLVGAIYTREAWPLVKEGKLAGWSLGGRARRVAGDTKLPTPAAQRGHFATVKSASLADRVRATLDGRA